MNLPPSQMPQIQNGATGAAVKQLQCLLKKSMLNISTLQIDGEWGASTQSAFTAFQKCNNTTTERPPDGPPPYRTLELDGQAGMESWTDLDYWDNQDFSGDAYYCNGFRHY
jgi:peptidoglycan hydrolase-like protein with peptidoglycan-binding domain